MLFFSMLVVFVIEIPAYVPSAFVKTPADKSGLWRASELVFHKTKKPTHF
jgi:hypothetical protein